MLRNELNLEQKINLSKENERDLSYSEVINKFSVSIGCVQNILRRKIEHLDDYKSNQNKELKESRLIIYHIRLMIAFTNGLYFSDPRKYQSQNNQGRKSGSWTLIDPNMSLGSSMICFPSWDHFFKSISLKKAVFTWVLLIPLLYDYFSTVNASGRSRQCSHQRSSTVS